MHLRSSWPARVPGLCGWDTSPHSAGEFQSARKLLLPRVRSTCNPRAEQCTPIRARVQFWFVTSKNLPRSASLPDFRDRSGQLPQDLVRLQCSWSLLGRCGTNTLMLRRALLLAQGTVDGGALLQAQSLRPSGGLYFCFKQSAFQLRPVVILFQVVPQSLALLSKRKSQEVDETVSGDTQPLLLRIHGETQHRGKYLRRRRERPGRNGEQLFHPGMQLCGGGKHSVFASSRFGGDAIGNFALHHDHNALKIL